MVSQSRCMFPGLGLNWRSLLLFLVGVLLRGSEACSSRSTPKPRSPIHSAIRPDITFQTYACPPAYAAWYCLNGATCFAVKIAESILYNCECADGYMGQRCEFKDPDGSYLPARKKTLSFEVTRFWFDILNSLWISHSSCDFGCSLHETSNEKQIDPITKRS
ncbi:KRN [Lepeophtheirus salmonis]|uniref:KRN n=1 Tax=Lepeophtheirus salmonis TaxID=72036 RepID=A0A7R8CKW6_LEPSM|nr:KRN [Lepeophtheirus salmonis]CAF2850671.1 KRN [Lepeophtheirus salmonis]